MVRTSRLSAQKGMTLMELLVALGLASTLMILLLQVEGLGRRTFTLHFSIWEVQQQVLLLSQVMEQEVKNSLDLQVPSPNRLVLIKVNGKTEFQWDSQNGVLTILEKGEKTKLNLHKGIQIQNLHFIQKKSKTPGCSIEMDIHYADYTYHFQTFLSPFMEKYK
ncbi:MAG: prepilin-type N-terminal cleavage/methylation domain-containing protein [Planctomycetota bacterium]|nr:MAG: prepilin-type N-terminal cleavage/methylation domain-containing protein [Planctomycetota bacterium]